jgi:hypothetical protein
MVNVSSLDQVNLRSGTGRQLLFDRSSILTIYLVHFKRAGNSPLLKQIRMEQSAMVCLFVFYI